MIILKDVQKEREQKRLCTLKRLHCSAPLLSHSYSIHNKKAMSKHVFLSWMCLHSGMLWFLSYTVQFSIHSSGSQHKCKPSTITVLSGQFSTISNPFSLLKSSERQALVPLPKNLIQMQSELSQNFLHLTIMKI